MMRGLSAFLVVLLLYGAAPLGAAGDLEKVTLDKRSYVTVDSLCRRLGMEAAVFPEKGPVEVAGGGGDSMRLEMHQRSIYLNGLRAWLSFPIRQDDQGRAVISELDVEKLILPVMRPLEFLKKREIKGVVIDPGHGGADRGARSRSGYTEKESTLQTAFHLRDILEREKIPYLMTRTTDTFVSLSERARIANQHPDYIFISIHYNSAHHEAHGVETYAMTPKGAGSTSSSGRVRHYDEKSYDGNNNDIHNIVLTQCIHREMAGLHSSKGDRGIKRARFVVLRECQVPGVLVEAGFMTSPLDRVLIEGDTYKQKVAEAIHRGLVAYMNLSKGQQPQAPAPGVEQKSPPPPDAEDTPYELLKEAVVKKELDSDTAAPVNARLFSDRQAAIRHRLEVALRQAVEPGEQPQLDTGSPEETPPAPDGNGEADAPPEEAAGTGEIAP